MFHAVPFLWINGMYYVVINTMFPITYFILFIKNSGILHRSIIKESEQWRTS